MVSRVVGRWGARFHAMGTENEVQLYAGSPGEAKSAIDEIINLFLSLEAKYSRYSDTSVVSKLNRAAGSEPVLVDEETGYLLDVAQSAYEASSGLFDVTSGVLRRVWNRNITSLPGEEDLSKVLPLVGWDKVQWQKPYVLLSKAGMELDLGGFVKEYAVDQAINLLCMLGVEHGLINGGGDIRVVGGHPNGEPWVIGIRDPHDPKKTLRSYSLMSGALVTSGDYERGIVVADRRYSHILNPESGWPVACVDSVSVIGDTALVAGVVSTVAMLRERTGIEFLEEVGVDYLVVNCDSVTARGGFFSAAEAGWS